MKMFDRIREWASRSDADKTQLDRRAFLKGMALTSAGLLVPGAAVFDVGRVTRYPDFQLIGWSWVPEARYARSTKVRVPEEGLPSSTVLGADDPDRRTIGFKVYEKLGRAEFTPDFLLEKLDLGS